jgi:hypothetical protein
MTYIEDIKKPRGFINIAYFTAEHMKTKLAGASKTSKKIKVDEHFSNYDITVQEYEDGELLHCNHAGAELDDVDYGYPDATICDYRDDWRRVPVCDKCNEVIDND